MSKNYQVILNDADSTAEFLQFIGEDAGWRECVVIDKFWTTTYLIYTAKDGFNKDNYYVGIIHLLTIDDVAIPGASIFEPYEDGDNGEYYAQTRPLLAYIRADGKQAFIPAKYDHPPFYDID
jgi:hypothetical protein